MTAQQRIRQLEPVAPVESPELKKLGVRCVQRVVRVWQATIKAHSQCWCYCTAGMCAALERKVSRPAAVLQGGCTPAGPCKSGSWLSLQLCQSHATPMQAFILGTFSARASLAQCSTRMPLWEETMHVCMRWTCGIMHAWYMHVHGIHACAHSSDRLFAAADSCSECSRGVQAGEQMMQQDRNHACPNLILPFFCTTYLGLRWITTLENWSLWRPRSILNFSLAKLVLGCTLGVGLHAGCRRRAVVMCTRCRPCLTQSMPVQGSLFIITTLNSHWLSMACRKDTLSADQPDCSLFCPWSVCIDRFALNADRAYERACSCQALSCQPRHLQDPSWIMMPNLCFDLR